MNPHRLCWGFAVNMPFAQIVAITLLLALVFNRQKLSVPSSGIIPIWIALLVWMVITTAFAIYPDEAFVQLVKVLKIQIITLLTLLLISDYTKLRQLIAVIVVSIAFFSTKGGLFTILTGGAFRVWGPSGSFIHENNSLAVATLMILPLMYYLYREYSYKWYLKYIILAAMLLSSFSVVGSQSRGAFVAVFAVATFFWLKSKSKILGGLVLLVMVATTFAFMPESWHERMDSIKNYQEDSSAMGRLNAWGYAINVASSRVTGAGFESWKPEAFAIWAQDPDKVHAAHSIYFGILADHGWFGLSLFLLILLLTWRALSKVIRETRNQDKWRSRNLLAKMLQVSLIAYFAGGAFLSLSYFDLPWHIIAISILLQKQLEDEKRKEASKPANGFRSIPSLVDAKSGL